LTIAIVTFTVSVFALVQKIFDNFGPGVARDLEWKTLRGAQELAGATDLGLAVQDADVVTRAFGDYPKNDDVVAIVAQGGDGKTVASYGQLPLLDGGLFSGQPGVVRPVGDLLLAWAPAIIEGSPVGRVAIVISTRRLVDSRQLLKRLSYGTFGAGLLALLCGALVVNFFTGSIAARDAQLADYASGLEKRVAERTAELARINQGMRLVLDNVAQGFITIDLEGVMSPERSTICDRWFGSSQPGTTLVEAISPRDQAAADWIKIGLAELREDVMPTAIVLDQMPSRMRLAERTMRLTYQPIFQGEKLERLLVVVTDITEEMVRERIERDSREMVRIFQHIAQDRNGFVQFIDELGHLVDALGKAQDSPEVEARLVHTIKGNCSMYGVESLSHLCHDLETKLREEERGMNPADRLSLISAWEHVGNMVRPLLGERRAAIELEEDDYTSIVSALRSGASTLELTDLVTSWRREPVAVRFARLADKAQFLARRLGKDPVVVHQDAHGLRLDAVRWNPFWSVAIHAINNALDHGIESRERRKASQKPEAGQIWFEAEGDLRRGLIIRFRDDGAGIDWPKVAEKARARGLPHEGHDALVEALFTEGVSTRDEASLTSGRGTGMGALREAVHALGGTINVISRIGQGTSFEFRFPAERRAETIRAA